VLDCIDRKLRSLGWNVASLIYDGVHVEHRDGSDLEAALREAETAVKKELGYSIALLEKPLFDPEGADHGVALDAIDEAADATAAAASAGEL